MDYQFIKIEREEKLAYLFINKAEVRNALDKATIDEMKAFMEEAKYDDTIGALVITGAGEKSFAAGADIKQLQERPMLEVLQTGGMKEFYNYIESYEKPTIAMINGYALGGGCELALACDIRIASENAKLGLPELNLGIIPGAGGTQRLARLIGKGKAIELILTGKIVSASEAKDLGLLSDVVPLEELKFATEKIADSILSKGPLAVRLAKLSIQYGFETDINTGLILEKLSQAILFATEDKNEGTSAFLEKRSPAFSGK
ncbi:enoyl-CoA hydratase/isomerase family protein [Metabacillus litoralis]|jgi:enoyl-CoA hydratase|uniref:enoyl-CoA hydratase/isomerase family protein n=1 Tax=Metabacillus litoralis TaxID=152268 RepID=UPI00203A8361|nr:enoyl-CoA hydratase-related protein [Metabacillus litoralis]MCM3653335.1 enoyl-CoA hydratase-related protein [Metabacillus litoralis]